MKESREKRIYENRCKLQHGQDHTECDRCDETLIFAMRDKYHEFSIGLTQILHCLAIAQQEGYVPELPDQWWNDINGRY